MGEKIVTVQFTFVMLRDSIQDKVVLKHLTRPDVELVFIDETDALPVRKDRPVIALVQCTQILEHKCVRLPGKDVVLAIPRWALAADCAVGVSKKPPQKFKRNPIDNGVTKKAIECMLQNWGFQKRKQAA